MVMHCFVLASYICILASLPPVMNFDAFESYDVASDCLSSLIHDEHFPLETCQCFTSPDASVRPRIQNKSCFYMCKNIT